MKKAQQGLLPQYQLVISNGQYPFKNAQLSKIFKMMVYSETQLDSNILHKILQAYQSIQSPLLIGVMGLEKLPQNKTKIQYEYVDTSLAKYIRRSIHQNIQLKLQKLYIELRNLANKFVLKNINVMNALHAKNIGIKISDIYRQTTFTIASLQSKKQNKQIQMPDFKVFIDFDKCQIIQKTQNIGKIVVETDKMIYNTICEDVSSLLKTIQQENRKKMSISSYYSMQTVPENGVFTFSSQQNITEGQLQFNRKLKRRKRNKMTQPSPKNEQNQQQQADTKSERIIRVKSNKLQDKNEIIDSKELSIQVHDLLQKSRRTLENFKNKIRIKS